MNDPTEVEIVEIDDLFTWTVDRADDSIVTRWRTPILGLLADDPDADPIPVGEAELYIVPETRVSRLFDELDALSEDLSYVAERLTLGNITGMIEAEDELVLTQPAVAVLRTIEIEARARGLGGPETVLREFALVNPTVGLIALRACPINASELTDAEVESASGKLIRMWRTLGFDEDLPGGDDVLVARADRFREGPR